MTLENKAIDFLKVYILTLILRCNKKNLENDIRLINDQIQALNVSNGMPNIRLDKPLQKTKIFNKGSKSKTIVKFCYNDLYDGVHADAFLSQWWYSCIICTTALHFLHNQHAQFLKDCDQINMYYFFIST